MAVTASAEVLFGPQGQVTNWTRQFSNRVTGATRSRAPSNSRPTWGHEPAARGKSLKTSFTSNTQPRPVGLKVFAAVGSSAKYSAFVDQGTGIYAGNSPWEARVLPPTARGASNLYEATWRPAGPEGDRVAGVMIKGQRAQHFFAEGLHDAFMSVGMATVKVPGSTLRGSVDVFPEDLARSVTAATEADAAFLASLTQWREWRDAAWRRGDVLGQGGSGSTQRELSRRNSIVEAKRANRVSRRVGSDAALRKSREDGRRRQEAFRARARATRDTVASRPQRREAERVRFLAAAMAKYGSRVDPSSLRFQGGRWYLDVLVRAQPRAGGPVVLVPRLIKGRPIE
jgi:hypothetical protein